MATIVVICIVSPILLAAVAVAGMWLRYSGLGCVFTRVRRQK